jgi:hypothetical protein
LASSSPGELRLVNLAVEIRSAGKREEELRDIPASVTILTRDEIAGLLDSNNIEYDKRWGRARLAELALEADLI